MAAERRPLAAGGGAPIFHGTTGTVVNSALILWPWPRPRSFLAALASIGGFRDTYLGRQVVGGSTAGMESARGLGERCEFP